MDPAAGPLFQLNGQTLLTIGGIIGALVGAVTFLFKALLASKDSQIATLVASTERQLTTLQRELEAQRAMMLGEITSVKTDRDFYRNLVLRERSANR